MTPIPENDTSFIKYRPPRVCPIGCSTSILADIFRQYSTVASLVNEGYESDPCAGGRNGYCTTLAGLVFVRTVHSPIPRNCIKTALSGMNNFFQAVELLCRVGLENQFQYALWTVLTKNRPASVVLSGLDDDLALALRTETVRKRLK